MPQFNVDDLTLFYREHGSGTPLVILPGNTATSVCHEGELEYFGDRFHTVSPDFRGTGSSSRLQQWPGDWWEICADDVVALLDHLGLKQAVLMGTSGGANIALLTAIRHPERVLAVVADSCVETYSPDNLRQEVKQRELRTDNQVQFWTWANGDEWEAVVNADSGLLLNLAEQGGDIYRGRLPQIKCPVLLTGSLHDSFLPDIEAQQQRIAEQIPNCRVVQHSDGDHPFMWTSPDRFRAAADEFLARFV